MLARRALLRIAALTHRCAAPVDGITRREGASGGMDWPAEEEAAVVEAVEEVRRAREERWRWRVGLWCGEEREDGEGEGEGEAVEEWRFMRPC